MTGIDQLKNDKKCSIPCKYIIFMAKCFYLWGSNPARGHFDESVFEECL